MKIKKHKGLIRKQLSIQMHVNLKISQSTELSEGAKKQVFDLWNSEYPEKLSYNNLAELDSYLQNLAEPKHYILTNDHDLLVGWAFTFDRANEKWFAIILSEKIKGKGFGRKMLNEIKRNESTLNGWVIDHDNDQKKNGQPYISPLKFYEKCGFNILSEIRLELDKISAVKIHWTKQKK